MLVVRNDVCETSVYVSGDAANATTTSLWRIILGDVRAP